MALSPRDAPVIRSSTSNQRLLSVQHAQTSEITATAVSRSGGIDSKYCECASTHTSIKAQHSATPSRTANIRVRRSKYDSTLVRSPARAGYATRMRQLFEDAGRDGPNVQNTDKALYPQLPNISRKASPSLVKGIALQPSATYLGCRQEFLCLSTNLPVAVSQVGKTHASLERPSTRSSESWSDDSGYFVTSPLGRSCTLSMAPKERIYNWLMEISDQEGELDEVHKETTSNTLGLRALSGELELRRLVDSSDETTESDRDEILDSSRQKLVLPEREAAPDDPFLNRDIDFNSPFRTNLQRPSVCIDFKARQVADICAHLTFDHHKETRTLQTGHSIGTSPQHLDSVTEMKKGCDDNQAVEEGGLQLSALSPNVCTERGTPRLRAKCESRSKPMCMTPSKILTAMLSRSPGLKENVGLESRGIGTTGSPVTHGSNLYGVQLRRLH